MIEKHSIQLRNSLVEEIRELVSKLKFAWKRVHASGQTEAEIIAEIKRFEQLYSEAVCVVNKLYWKFDMEITSIYSKGEDYLISNMIIQSVNSSMKKEILIFTPSEDRNN